jgi:methylated-DNA-[protein]-cysteine S-methyltransferase
VALTAATHPTPAGPFTVLADADGAVVAAGWLGAEALGALFAPGPLRERRDAGAASRAVREYLDGDLAAPAAVPVRQRSGPFVEHAWTVLRAVAPGAPITYAALAARCGRPDAPRAAASACARNAAALFVPCHRIVRTTGALGGFRYGLARKRWLLDHEAGDLPHHS